MKEGDKKKHKVVFWLLSLSLLGVLLGIFALNLVFSQNEALYLEEKGVIFSVSDVDREEGKDKELDFGSVLPGKREEKDIKISNGHPFRVKFNVYVSNSIREYIFGKREFYLESGESKRYKVILKVPKEAEKKDYSGSIKFEGHRSRVLKE